jgi:hypothetical protein
MSHDWRTGKDPVTEALQVIHPEALLCNCRQAYSPDGRACPDGCSANQLKAKDIIAKAFVELHAKRTRHHSRHR